ncbi:uncharacterized protein LOC128991033 [Macrosteles quadrilineatus]|uniref:uncharacterized protein LOC128991033 n=1 Tax=Macrosteles quadrilineatus TaxID=74068 RepID=UPI0023E1BEBA|nr:uncharacterized protein LOC128991033 [Macrosteles quadrilineatus]
MGPRLLLLYPPLLFLFIFYLSPTSEAFPVSSPRQRQYLPPLPGYIPVYIQHGETPPDVEALSDQSPTQDKMDTDVAEVPEKADGEDSLDDIDSLRALRESEEFIVQQLTDNVRANEVRGLVEEVHGPRP